MNIFNPIIFCAKFGWNWPSGSGEEENVTNIQTDGQQAISEQVT